MKKSCLLLGLALFLCACQKKESSLAAWQNLPTACELKGAPGENVLELPGTNRVLLMGKKLALPKYAAFYTEPGQDPKSIVPMIIAIGERQYFSGEIYADTNKVGFFKSPSVFEGTFISKHGYYSRTSFRPLKVPGESVHLTFWANQSAIREANLRRWNDILSYHDDAYRERMAKAFRTTNTQTDEVWDDDKDLTVRIRYEKDDYTYMFYNSGNTKNAPGEVEPVDVFKKLTAEIETRENPTNKDLHDVMLYFSYGGGDRYYMYKRDYDLEACYWRQAEHVTLQNDPAKVRVRMILTCKGGLLDTQDLTLGDFVKGYFPYATFTNWVTGVSVKAPPVGSVLKITVDGGPLYGLIDAEKEF
ncbi:hypothetical protein J6T93_03775 [bacterium]|nr:hypothetical protein [bacterium]